MPPPSSGVTDNSGLIDLERLSEAIRSTTEAKSEAIVAAAAVDPAVSVPTPAPTAPAVGLDSAPPASDLTPLSPSVRLASEAEAPPLAPAAPVARATADEAASGSKVPLVAAVAVLVAAGAFFAARKGEAPAPVPVPAPVAEVAQAPAPVVEAPKPLPPTEAPAAEASKPVVAKAESTRAEAVKAEEAPAPAATTATATAEAAKAAAGAKNAGTKAVGGAGAKSDKSFVEEMAAAVTGKLEAKSAVTETAAGPAGPAAGVAKPGTGQVSAAFAKVKGAAHGCLGGQEIEVKTTVTFGSDGKVTKVAVANAPDPAIASCIEGAVGKATVPPFTDPTFSAPLTVR